MSKAESIYLTSVTLNTIALLTSLLFQTSEIMAERLPDVPPHAAAISQVPSWSDEDLGFFLHGSMSSEVVPELVLQAFIATYPDLYSTRDLSQFGLIPDPAFGWPIGFSRDTVRHLGGLRAVGLNCAACHVGELSISGSTEIRQLPEIPMPGTISAPPYPRRRRTT